MVCVHPSIYYCFNSLTNRRVTTNHILLLIKSTCLVLDFQIQSTCWLTSNESSVSGATSCTHFLWLLSYDINCFISPVPVLYIPIIFKYSHLRAPHVGVVSTTIYHPFLANCGMFLNCGLPHLLLLGRSSHHSQQPRQPLRVSAHDSG